MSIVLEQADREWLDKIYQLLCVKLNAQTQRIGSCIPYIPTEGRYGDCDTPEGIYWWTNGFWPGILWQMYHATGEALYRQAAEGVEDRLDEALHGFEGLYHDVGFMFSLSAVAQYRSTGNANARRRGLHAATLLAGRFNPTGNFIRAWNEASWSREDVSGWMIVDCLMNLPLLFWASAETGDPRFADIARRHADTALQHTLRPDGSSNHIVILNPVTGEFIDSPGGQGYGPGSAWSRGQAWALYGYALCYRYTGNPRYLEASKRSAHFCIANLAVSGWLPLVDFRAPVQPVKYDATAGMAIAAGLLELAHHVGEYEKALYTNPALQILRACETRFCSWDPAQDAIVGGGTTLYHGKQGADVPIIYGDYYMVESILHLLGKSFLAW